jgi:tetratricopeptide (TPR) repeat protein
MRKYLEGALAVVGFIAAMFTAQTASSDTKPDRAVTCFKAPKNSDIGALAIDACTSMIQSGQLTGTALAWPYNSRGVAYTFTGEFNLAIRDFDQAIRLKPEFAIAFFNRGRVYDQMNDMTARAIQDYDRAIQLKPDYAAAFYRRGGVYTSLGQKQAEAFRLRLTAQDSSLSQYKLAIQDFDQAILLNPDYVDALRARGLCYADLGENVRAIEDEDRVLQLKPDDAGALGIRGLAKLAAGDTAGGSADITRLKALSHDGH